MRQVGNRSRLALHTVQLSKHTEGIVLVWVEEVDGVGGSRDALCHRDPVATGGLPHLDAVGERASGLGPLGELSGQP